MNENRCEAPSLNVNPLTRPGVHRCRGALVASRHGRDADAVLGARKQVWGTKTQSSNTMIQRKKVSHNISNDLYIGAGGQIYMPVISEETFHFLANTLIDQF